MKIQNLYAMNTQKKEFKSLPYGVYQSIIIVAKFADINKHPMRTIGIGKVEQDWKEIKLNKHQNIKIGEHPYSKKMIILVNVAILKAQL